MNEARRIFRINAADPPERFPDPELALREPNGLLAVGGDLSPARLVAAYRRGIFPWFSAGEPVLWWSPDPRAVLLPGDLRISRSLRRAIRHGGFAISIDADFTAVIAGCAHRPRSTGTWITPEMLAAYRELHRLGFAHSIEVWHEGELAGGLYGVALDGAFFGESMFSRRTDASKLALVRLVRMLEAGRLRLIDCQLPNPHLLSLGCRLLPRREFLARISMRHPLEGQPGITAEAAVPAASLLAG